MHSSTQSKEDLLLRTVKRIIRMGQAAMAIGIVLQLYMYITGGK